MARDRPGHFNEDMSGLAAFRAALKPQEGQFMRGASYIMNEPKDVAWKSDPHAPERNSSKVATDNERIASALVERNAKGQFVKQEK
jgi:hypothetical protein